MAERTLAEADFAAAAIGLDNQTQPASLKKESLQKGKTDESVKWSSVSVCLYAWF